MKLAGRASVLELSLPSGWALPVLAEIIRRYAVSTTQLQRPHGFWVKKEVYPVEDDFECPMDHEIIDKPQPAFEASEESLIHKDRGDGERPVNTRVVQAAPLGCDSKSVLSHIL
uniref:uncharacterized protein LOC100429360 n=1 Tax=Macaca mulatta TaxID=9544 RepID=UPI0010A25DAA|nr:uncharacterized protein LOC100429360 [Macaca mulatta]